MSAEPPPLREHQWAQEELRWGFCEAESQLGKRSIFPALISMLEGRDSAWEPIDLAEDPAGALAQARSAARLGQARRYRIFKTGLARIGLHLQWRLAMTYGAARPGGMSAFGALAALALASPEAVRLHKGSRSRLRGLDWLRKLSHRIHPGRDARGRSILSTATEDEVRLFERIRRECQSQALEAVEAWISATGDVRLDQRKRSLANKRPRERTGGRER